MVLAINILFNRSTIVAHRKCREMNFLGDGSLAAVRNGLAREGHEARAIVIADKIRDPVGHAFNAVRIDGVVYFVDGQTAKVLTDRDFSNFKNFRFIITNRGLK